MEPSYICQQNTRSMAWTKDIKVLIISVIYHLLDSFSFPIWEFFFASSILYFELVIMDIAYLA